MSRYLSHLAALTLNRVEPVQPRLASRFETPADMEPSDNSRLDPAHEFQAAAPVNVQPNKVSGRQDQPTEFIINKPESYGGLPKPSPTAFDTKLNTEQSTHRAQPVDEPVTQTFYGIRKDALPTENTHNKLVIREVAIPNTTQKNSSPEESPRAAPVKPASIVVRSEQPIARQNTPSQTGSQFQPSATDTTPAPTIQVTIGRIEIRATQIADKPVSKPRAANTTMSLEDYLKQRNGSKT